MNTLIGKHIILRALEPTDIEFLLDIENNEQFWQLSNTQQPFSKYLLAEYLKNAHQDIYEAKQLRLVITDANSQESIGMIDLFDFDPKNKRAGIGIFIQPQFQNKGYGKEALNLLIKYAFIHLDLHQLYANITDDNKNSIKLFESLEFKKIGSKKDWIYFNNTYKNELLYQLIND